MTDHSGGSAFDLDKQKQNLVLTALAGALFIASLVLCLVSLDATAWTYDEPNYLDASRHIAGLGTRPEDREAASDPEISKQLAEAYPFDRENTILHPPLTYYINGLLMKWAPMGDAEEDLNMIRIVNLLSFFLITVVIACLWARELFGAAAALLTTGLLVLCPIVLAHARLATTDMAACSMFFAFFYCLWRLFRNPGWGWTALTGFLLGLALLTKYSTVLAVPIALVVFGSAAIAGRRDRSAGREGAVPGGRLFLHLSVLFAGALFLLLAAYAFAGAFGTLEGGTFRSGFFRTLAGTPVLNSLPVPLPAPYLQGLDFQKQITETGFTSFLLGEKHFHGVWYFFPFCFLIKMPLPFLVLLGAGIWVFFRHETGLPRSRICLALPPALFFLYLVWPNTSNAGFRYALPVIPFCCVLAGGAVRYAARSTGKARLVHGGILIALCAWYAAGTLSIHPHYLAYHNEAAGGPENAWRLVAGSDLDWGQDQETARERFTEWSEKEKITPQPGPLPVTGKVIINVNEVQDCLRRRDVYGWLRRFDPVDSIGYTYLIFDLKLDDFRRQAEENSGAPEACFGLAAALMSEGRMHDCRKELDRGLKLEPHARLRYLDGKFHLAVRQTPQAIFSLTKATQIDPTLFDAFMPLRFFLLRAGRLEEEARIRKRQIESEIRFAHVGWQDREKRALAQKAARGDATVNELCSLAVLSWIDGSLRKALDHARTAERDNPENLQALGNLIFLLAECGTAAEIMEAMALRGRLDELTGTSVARSTPVLRSSPSERIVFGDILTFSPPALTEIQIRFLLQKGPDVGRDNLVAALTFLLDPGSLSSHARFLPETLRLLLRGKELFPGDSEIGKLEDRVEQLEQTIR